MSIFYGFTTHNLLARFLVFLDEFEVGDVVAMLRVFQARKKSISLLQLRAVLRLAFMVRFTPNRTYLDLLRDLEAIYLQRQNKSAVDDPERVEFTQWFEGKFIKLVHRFPGGKKAYLRNPPGDSE